MTKEERLQKQMQRLAEMKQMEQALHALGYRYIAGVDEVGRGPLAGPVVTAAVVLPEEFNVPGIDDSKKLSEKRREALYDSIMEEALAVGIGMASHQVIDEINILQATKRAMRQAIGEANRQLCGKLMAGENGHDSGEHDGAQESRERDAAQEIREHDGAQESREHDGAREAGKTAGAQESRDPDEAAPAGIDFVLLDAVELPDLEIPQQSVIKGDAKVLAIAAASIIAKVTRDRMMVKYAEEYPGYAFERNKGYGTKDHYAGIREHGVCPIHRRTFLKVIH